MKHSLVFVLTVLVFGSGIFIFKERGNSDERKYSSETLINISPSNKTKVSTPGYFHNSSTMESDYLQLGEEIYSIIVSACSESLSESKIGEIWDDRNVDKVTRAFQRLKILNDLKLVQMELIPIAKESLLASLRCSDYYLTINEFEDQLFHFINSSPIDYSLVYVSVNYLDARLDRTCMSIANKIDGMRNGRLRNSFLAIPDEKIRKLGINPIFLKHTFHFANNTTDELEFMEGCLKVEEILNRQLVI